MSRNACIDKGAPTLHSLPEAQYRRQRMLPAKFSIGLERVKMVNVHVAYSTGLLLKDVPCKPHFDFAGSKAELLLG